MFKIKATEGVNILISDLGLVVTSNTEQIISDEDYEKSSDLQKVSKFLIITQVNEEDKINEISEPTDIVEEEIDKKTSFIKEIDNLEDNPEFVEEKKEKIFVANYNEPDIKLDEEIEDEIEIKVSSDFKPVVEEKTEPIVRDAENGKIVNTNSSFTTDIEKREEDKKEVKVEKKTRKNSAKKTTNESSEKKTKSTKKPKTIKAEEEQTTEKQIEVEKLENK